MKLAVSATGDELDAQLDRRFGRCSFFLLVDTDTMEFETIQNSSRSASGGAGVKAAQTLADSEVDGLITGNIGPNAFNALTSAGINIFTGASGTVKEAIEKYSEEELSQANEPTADGGSGK
ncbi:NifB/NifX family molybdenum-iron cluster-binding protein [Candidatus Bipolaricaulota bacterium]|nr:NifB/NifX family molybdenum-iron cluster-binding protein [Candidatus Bipolaricaulota bacterium]